MSSLQLGALLFEYSLQPSTFMNRGLNTASNFEQTVKLQNFTSSSISFSSWTGICGSSYFYLTGDEVSKFWFWVIT